MYRTAKKRAPAFSGSKNTPSISKNTTSIISLHNVRAILNRYFDEGLAALKVARRTGAETFPRALRQGDSCSSAKPQASAFSTTIPLPPPFVRNATHLIANNIATYDGVQALVAHERRYEKEGGFDFYFITNRSQFIVVNRAPPLSISA